MMVECNGGKPKDNRKKRRNLKMDRSEHINELAAALSKAQGAMGVAKKDSANPFFKSTYSDFSSVVNAIREPLSANGLSFVQVTEPSDKNEVIVETVLMHSSGQWCSSKTAIPVNKADAQGYGSAITYGKRYGLQGIVGVPSADDDGNAAAKAAPKQETPKPESAKTISQVAWESMDEAQVTLLTDISLNMIALLSEGRATDAIVYVRKQGLDADEQAALNSCFDSKQRAALKKASLEMKPDVQDDLTSQA